MPENKVVIYRGRCCPNIKHLSGRRVIVGYKNQKPPILGGDVSIGANQLVGIHAPPPPVMRLQDNNPAPPIISSRGGALLSGMNFHSKMGVRHHTKKSLKDEESNIKFVF